MCVCVRVCVRVRVHLFSYLFIFTVREIGNAIVLFATPAAVQVYILFL